MTGQVVHFPPPAVREVMAAAEDLTSEERQLLLYLLRQDPPWPRWRKAIWAVLTPLDTYVWRGGWPLRHAWAEIRIWWHRIENELVAAHESHEYGAWNGCNNEWASQLHAMNEELRGDRPQS